MKKTHIFFILLFAIHSFSIANITDSLKIILQHPRITPIEMAEIQQEIAQNYFEEKLYDSAVIYIRKSVQAYAIEGTLQQQASALQLNNRILSKLGYNKKYLPSQHQLIKLLIQIGDSNALVSGYDKLGYAFHQLYIFDSAIYYYNEAYKIGSLLGDQKFLMDSYNNISQVYQYQGNHEKELEFCKKGLKLAQESENLFDQGTFYHNAAIAFKFLGQNDSGLIYAKKALAINKSISNTDREALNRTAIGMLYAMNNQIEKGMELFLENLQYHTKVGNQMELQMDNYNLSYSYYFLGEYESAIKYAFECLRISKLISDVNLEMEAYDLLSQSYNGLKNDSKALMYFKKYHSLNDSLIRSTNFEVLSKIQSEYEYDRNESEIKLLSTENQLKERQVNSVISTLVIIVISLIILIGVLLVLFRKFRRIEELHGKLNKSYHDITKSHEKLKEFETNTSKELAFARSLQDSFFNDSSDLDKIFKHVYYKSYSEKPIQNSFLWGHKLGNKLYWAIVNIEQKQIKGAFTSMYLYNMLNNVYFDKKYSNVESFMRFFINKVDGPFSEEADFGGIQMYFSCLDTKKLELEFVNIGVQTELLRNTKVWNFKPASMTMESDAQQQLKVHHVQLQSDDQLMLFSKNWSQRKDSDAYSAAFAMDKHTDIGSSETERIEQFVKEIQSDSEIDEFMFFHLSGIKSSLDH
ncbi:MULTISPECIES: tetratricopeptide repeat protein [unclassified Lentimicrobium]|uniref:tetratricopeptide repeat protein n=1 Tax=unclassified Lentimicrobium TaxID=2677434 RepID=UPI001555EE28|nr:MULTISPECIES: tetratricopeptide repeat protein [unclassified Lentimicrobium]NPD44095.1 tetratricopeptide repeat protein [Lentimicrobium sp. S6]NPD86236.1 tetratricopeptide repeat protein [Lentimicrobium sp. L6]